MKDKIIKLLSSNIYGDIYIGLKLLDELKRWEAIRVLKESNFSYRRERLTTWEMSRKIEDVPEEMDSQYIEGKLWYYGIATSGIYIDAKDAFTTTQKDFKNDEEFKIKESWK